jgi:hypothetical protein
MMEGGEVVARAGEVGMMAQGNKGNEDVRQQSVRSAERKTGRGSVPRAYKYVMEYQKPSPARNLIRRTQ